MIRQHLQGIYERPGAVSRLLLEIHKVVPESPYAGIWAAAGISEGENDNSFAQRLLQQSIERIKQQQQSLPNRHRITLASAYNNLGVVSLKERGANQAAASLVNAIKTSSVVPAAPKATRAVKLSPGPNWRETFTAPSRSKRNARRAMGQAS
ncbi:hypothetical protein Enr13x_20970 [Stieleria neptunia]|uniref:Tetratricopeptide repeat protein n=1 Tax=Stieleria neptunia TaxID=2527979 RepID=A0A518HN16_9BACT|nr:hypothetical protein [Stieleria neptunia]QDV42252.1 hypothetical protein Enr13x_20970 [Stieleria neptunia]